MYVGQQFMAISLFAMLIAEALLNKHKSYEMK